MRTRTNLVRGLSFGLVVTTLLTLSATAASARAMRIEPITVRLQASNSASYPVTIVGSTGASTRRSRGRRQYPAWTFNYVLPSGAAAASRSWRFDVAPPSDGLGTAVDDELDSVITLRIQWPKNGVTQTCMLEATASYNETDFEFILRLGDVARVADGSGTPSSTRCARN